jgi:hypothetical protein
MMDELLVTDLIMIAKHYRIASEKTGLSVDTLARIATAQSLRVAADHLDRLEDALVANRGDPSVTERLAEAAEALRASR